MRDLEESEIMTERRRISKPSRTTRNKSLSPVATGKRIQTATPALGKPVVELSTSTLTASGVGRPKSKTAKRIIPLRPKQTKKNVREPSKNVKMKPPTPSLRSSVRSAKRMTMVPDYEQEDLPFRPDLDEDYSGSSSYTESVVDAGSSSDGIGKESKFLKFTGRAAISGDDQIQDFGGDIVGKHLKDGKFRMEHGRVLVTYPGWLDKKELETYYREIPKFGKFEKKYGSNNPGVKFIVIAHELGSSSCYPHTHIVVEFKDKIKSTNCMVFDYQGPFRTLPEDFDLSTLSGKPGKEGRKEVERILVRGKYGGRWPERLHPNIQVCTFNQQVKWSAWVEYMKKEDPDNRGVKSQNSSDQVYDALQQTRTGGEVVRNFAQTATGKADPRSVPGLITAHAALRKDEAQQIMREEADMEYADCELRSWQKTLVSMLNMERFYRGEESRKNREIIWVYDRDGNSGKSWLGAYLEYKYPCQIAYISEPRDVKDMTQKIVMKHECGWGSKIDGKIVPKALVFDVPRSLSTYNSDFVQVLGTIEGMQNGKLTQTKYHGTDIPTRNTRMVVLSNSLPPILDSRGEDVMTPDRWFIMKLVNLASGTVQTVRLDYGQTKDLFRKKKAEIQMTAATNRKMISRRSEMNAQRELYGRNEEYDEEEVEANY